MVQRRHDGAIHLPRLQWVPDESRPVTVLIIAKLRMPV